ncbi:glycosyltransferase, partial [Clostridium sp.]
LVEIYSAADIFINSTLEDNFPTTNLEAIACGTPVITFNTGGSIECINKYTGKIVNSNSVDELAVKIKSLINDKIDLVECKKQAEKFYDKNFKFKEYLELFE